MRAYEAGLENRLTMHKHQDDECSQRTSVADDGNGGVGVRVQGGGLSGHPPPSLVVSFNVPLLNGGFA